MGERGGREIGREEGMEDPLARARRLRGLAVLFFSASAVNFFVGALGWVGVGEGEGSLRSCREEKEEKARERRNVRQERC